MSRKNTTPRVSNDSLLPPPVCTGIIYLPKGNKGKVSSKGYTKANLKRKQGEIGK